jgi:MFS family permease
MFLQQTFASVGKVLPAVVAPLVIAEFDADPAWVGVYYGVAAAASLVAQMGCGSFIVRYGALRMSQVALVLLGGGIAVAAEGSLPGFGASAIIGRGGAAVSTPTSSQLLSRVSPPRVAPLVISIKQTAVPAGLLISGFLAPAMASAFGWRGAALITAAACVAFAVMLQPCAPASTLIACRRGVFGRPIFEPPSRRFCGLLIFAAYRLPASLSMASNRSSPLTLSLTWWRSAMSWLPRASCSRWLSPLPCHAAFCGAGWVASVSSLAS